MSSEDADEINLDSGQEQHEPGTAAARMGDAPAKRDSAGHKAGVFARAAQFIRDVRSEMKRVSWPSFEDVRNTTIIVLVNVVFFAAFLFLVDRGWGYTITGFDWLVNKIFGAA